MKFVLTGDFLISGSSRTLVHGLLWSLTFFWCADGVRIGLIAGLTPVDFWVFYANPQTGGGVAAALQEAHIELFLHSLYYLLLFSIIIRLNETNRLGLIALAFCLLVGKQLAMIAAVWGELQTVSLVHYGLSVAHLGVGAFTAGLALQGFYRSRH